MRLDEQEAAGKEGASGEQELIEAADLRLKPIDDMNELELEAVTGLGNPADTFSLSEQRAFTRALEVLNEAGVPYLVSGALATHHYTGIWRASKDLDLFLCREDLDSALHALKGHGFRTEIANENWLAKAYREPYFVDLIWSGANTVLHVERDWIERGNPGKVLGVPVRFISPADLLAMQVFLGERFRWDAAAIQHLILCTRETINWQLVLEHLGDEHWPLLLSHLILFQYVYPSDKDAVPAPIMRDLLERMTQATADPPLPGHICRGLYLSKVNYHVDFADWGYASPVQRD